MCIRFLSLSFILLSANFSLADDLVFNCEDNSYYLNHATLIKGDNGFELSISGAGIGPLQFDRLDESLIISPWNFFNTIYIPFADAECSISDDKKTGHCEKAGNIWDAFFVGREINNLDTYVSTITSFTATMVTLDYSQTNIKISFYGTRAGVDNDVQTITFAFNTCSEEFSGGFPEELRDYISQNN